MGTAEILIVFSALMALIALVTIGIDWIGKPLKHRRFIPRIYRFDDEKLPIDEYGNTTFEVEVPGLQPAPMAMQPSPPMMAPQMMAPPLIPSNPMAIPNTSGALPQEVHTNPTVAVPAQPAPRQVAAIDSDLAVSATASRSAFTDSLAEPQTTSSPTSTSAATQVSGHDMSRLSDHGVIAGTAAATGSVTSSVDLAWTPELPLDTTVNDHKPSLAIKAERFWMTTAEAAHDSHFDTDDIARMASGKAPRRTNPRTGRTEAMQLMGLRQASLSQDVRMRWPDDSVDPWSST